VTKKPGVTVEPNFEIGKVEVFDINMQSERVAVAETTQYDTVHNVSIAVAWLGKKEATQGLRRMHLNGADPDTEHWGLAASVSVIQAREIAEALLAVVEVAEKKAKKRGHGSGPILNVGPVMFA